MRKQLSRRAGLYYNQAMQASWRRGRRRTLWTAALGLGLWTFLIYWQGDVTLAGLAQTLSVLVSLQFERIPPPFDSLLIDLGILILGVPFWMLFFGQFVLPLQKAEEGLQVVAEMRRGLLGSRPRALYIRNGKAQEAEAGAPRLLLLDSASAAVLRNESAYTRAVGPGLSFLRGGEHLAGTLDLRIQQRRLGPQPGEDPFAPQGNGETEAVYAARQARRQETSGLTRDGIEMAARLEVDLRVEDGAQEPADGQRSDKRAFGFHPDFAWRVMAHSGVAAQAPSDARGRHASWDWLPAHLAADLWREYLRKFSLMELFEAREFEGQALTGFEIVTRMMKRRLHEAIVPELDEGGQMGNRQVSSPEYQLLRSRGLRAVDVNVRELRLRVDEEEEKLIEAWNLSWQTRGEQAKSQRKLRASEKKGLGEQAAANDFLRQVSAGLYQRLLETDGSQVEPPDEAETLRILLDASLSGTARVPGLDESISEGLKQVRDWLESGDDGKG